MSDKDDLDKAKRGIIETLEGLVVDFKNAMDRFGVSSVEVLAPAQKTWVDELVDLLPAGLMVKRLSPKTVEILHQHQPAEAPAILVVEETIPGTSWVVAYPTPINTTIWKRRPGHPTHHQANVIPDLASAVQEFWALYCVCLVEQQFLDEIELTNQSGIHW